ncbi:hypothetical protein SOJ85_001875 [Cronobacter turicensis]|nr:hypothetical protein [Cronobacter turicensis]
MSTISKATRYRAGLDEDGIVCHREKKDGRWVKYEDYEELEKELLALRKERERAEPVYQCMDDGKWYDTEKRLYDEVKENGNECRVLYTAPPVADDSLPYDPQIAEYEQMMEAEQAQADTTSQQFESLAGKVVVPAGWKLMPIEPTVEMQIAFAETWFSKVRCVDDCELEDAYIAMLAAAPEPCK